jgi:hypothetical protein
MSSNHKVRHSVIVAVDIGSTWIKLGVADATDGRLLGPLQRWRSCTTQLTGGTSSTQRFIRSTDEVLEEILYLCRNAEVRALGLSGVREGLAVTSQDGNLVWASGNSPHVVDLFSGLGPTVGSVTSLQGTVAGWLTGKYAMCRSEATGLSLDTRFDACHNRLSVRVLDEAEPVGLVSGTRVPVFLVGYDEQVAVFGCDLSKRGGLQLNAATFWGLLTCNGDIPAVLAAGRHVPAIPPCPSYTAVVFPYWGEVVWLLHSSEVLESPFPDNIRDALPDLLGDRSVKVTDVLKYMKRRLTYAIDRLLPTDNSAPNRIVVTGGGSATRYRKIMSELLPRSCEASYMSNDATVTGIIQMVRRFCSNWP